MQARRCWGLLMLLGAGLLAPATGHADDALGRPPAGAVPSVVSADDPVAPKDPPPTPPELPTPTAEAPPAQPAVPEAGAQALPPAPPAAPAQEVVRESAVAQPALPPYACPPDCPPRCWACPERPDMYVSLSADMFSGLGGTGTFGWVMHRTEGLETSFEVAYTHMDQWEEFDGEGQRGKLDVLRAGLAWRTQPCCDRHWTWRAGLAYFRADGRPSEIDFDFVDIPIPGDYLGGYLGVGYEWDFGPCNRWSHGPELQVLGGWEVSEGEFAVTPTIRWGLTYRF